MPVQLKKRKLNFDSMNVSVQVGDIAYCSFYPTSVGGFDHSTLSNTKKLGTIIGVNKKDVIVGLDPTANNPSPHDINIIVEYDTAVLSEEFWTNIVPDALICGTGTGGTIMGTSKYLKEHLPNLKVIAVEPKESAVMSGGEPGLHGIQGIGDGSKFLVDLDKIDGVVTVATECAKNTARHLARKYGYFVGISAGANVNAAFKWLRDNDKRHAITFLCDRGERYFSCL